MKLEKFEMERMQSTWENLVKYNLSESGVHPVALGELVPDPADREEIFKIKLGYCQSNGTEELRRAVAALYEGAAEENVLVTTGTAEANYLVSWMLVEPGDEVVMMLPNYMQLWGLVRSFGAEVKPFHLVEELNWAPDLDRLDSLVGQRTKLIAVCNPNNPTGAVMTEEEMDRIVEAARRAGAWLVADEVYRGAERTRDLTPSFWGRYDKVIITSGLSKAYGLPGLRTGWIASTPEIVARAWSYHDYTTIGPSPIADLLARRALQPENRSRFLARTVGILNSNYPVLRRWVDQSDGLFSLVGPEAGAIAYLRYSLDVDSVEFADQLRARKDVLVVPGGHFHTDNYVRIGYGAHPDELAEGLKLIAEFVSEIQ